MRDFVLVRTSRSAGLPKRFIITVSVGGVIGRRVVINGQCHCGNLSFHLETTGPVQPRACQCGFCRAHGAVCASDPAGHAIVRIIDEGLLSRYRFAQRTADCLICRRCGVYLGAVLYTERGAFSTLNLNATAIKFPAAEPVDYEGESFETRVHRRAARWTPTEVISDAADPPGRYRARR